MRQGRNYSTDRPHVAGQGVQGALQATYKPMENAANMTREVVSKFRFVKLSQRW